MTTIDPCKLSADFHAAINAIDFTAIEGFFAEDATYVSGKVGGLKGRADIMAAFRRYFAEYPDQLAEDLLLEQVSPSACRSVWELTATSATTGLLMERRGEEIITFDEAGKVIDVAVTDYGLEDVG